MTSIRAGQLATGTVTKNGVVPGVSVITVGPALGHDINIDAASLKTLLNA